MTNSYHDCIIFDAKGAGFYVDPDPRPARSRAEWIDRFTMEVGRLSPASDPAQVAADAAIEHDEACGLSPEEAAAVFTSDAPE